MTINSNGTGSVTITAAGLALSPTSPTQYAIVGNRTIQRTSDFTTGGDFFANTINDELDQQTIFAQQNAEGLARALTAPQTDPTSINMTLPSKANRALKTLSFDVNGNPTPGVSAADVANATTYATNAANSATAAASSASSASSSASSASSSASTASTQASNASTSATNASNSASSASTSATNAAGSASTAATQASNASTSATNAASSASAASTSAANAATSATNASNSASTATTQASNAATSASSASGSATSAANSAAAAASALDSFDDRYLGTKSSDPTLDNDGNALAAGALYFSTSQNVMKVYDGASWITATSAGATSLLQFKYVATAGQTSFSGAATVGGTLTYTVNNIVVFLNGVALDSTDYTASTGTSVVLGTAAALNDELVIIAFKSFTVADTYTKGEVDGFAVKLTGNQTVAGVKTFSSNPVLDAGTANGVAYLNGSKVLTTGSALVFDGTNLGVGVTPSAWGGTSKALQLPAGSFESRGSTITTAQNAYFNGTNWIYSSTAGASLYAQNAGVHYFYNAPSGTANAAITFTQAMTLTAAGDLGLGTTSPSQHFQISGTSEQFISSVSTNGANAGVRMNSSGNRDFGIFSDGSLRFYDFTASAERARITSGGVMLAGATSQLINESSFGATSAANTATFKTTDGNSQPLLVWNSGTGASRPLITFFYGTTYTSLGGITTNGSVITYGGTSDYRLKNVTGNLSGYKERILAIQPKQGTWKADNAEFRGFLAHEFAEHYPSSVTGEKDAVDSEGNPKYQGMQASSAEVIADLVALIQEQQALITQLQADVAALKGA